MRPKQRLCSCKCQPKAVHQPDPHQGRAKQTSELGQQEDTKQHPARGNIKASYKDASLHAHGICASTAIAVYSRKWT